MKGPASYPSEAITTFSEAIDAAQAVVNDNNATQAGVDAAVATLAAAVSAFGTAVITEEG